MNSRNTLLLLFLLFFVVSCSFEDDNNFIKKQDFKGIQIMAHRGFWKPLGNADNALAAVQLALENNMHGASVDIRMSADSVFYLNHDAIIQGYVIRETPSHVLDQITLSNGDKMARFDAVLDLIITYDNFALSVEIKPQGNSNYKKYLAETAVEKIINKGLENKVRLISSDFQILKDIKSYNESIKTSFLTSSTDIDLTSLKNAKVNSISLYYKRALNNPDFIKRLVAEGFEVRLWTINTIPEVLRAINLPIGSISTDIPDEVMEIYK